MYIFVWNLYMLGINNNNKKVTYNFTCMCNRQGSRPTEIAFQHDHYSELQRPLSPIMGYLRFDPPPLSPQVTINPTPATTIAYIMQSTKH